MLNQLAAMLVGGWRFSNGGRVFGFEGFEPPPSWMSKATTRRLEHQEGRADAATRSPPDASRHVDVSHVTSEQRENLDAHGPSRA
jgi:hypothetical protein